MPYIASRSAIVHCDAGRRTVGILCCRALTDGAGNLQLAPPAERVRVTVGRAPSGEDGAIRPGDFQTYWNIRRQRRERISHVNEVARQRNGI